MVNIGDSELTIMIGDRECSAVYAGDEQIYPMNLGTLTGIAIENLTWVTDIAASGGTATSANCSFSVYGYYDSGRRKRVTKDSTITGSLVVPATSADTRQMVGTLTLTASYSGFTDSDTVDVYQKSVGPDLSTPLTFEIISGGTIFYYCGNSSYYVTIQYSKNGGTWTNITPSNNTSNTGGTNTITVQAGDIIEIKGNNGRFNQLSNTNSNRFYTPENNCKFNVYGNVMSLLSNNFENSDTVQRDEFYGLFYQNKGIISAEQMFLPATNLGSYCYRCMFRECTNMTNSPELLPATTIQSWCYSQMFYSCTTITTPVVLCATTLADACCDEMYRYCSNLEKAPDILANSLPYQAFSWTFANCPKLNYIKCLATDISGTRCTSGWVNGVSATGTFVKNPNMNSWSTGIDGIPNGWTVEVAS